MSVAAGESKYKIPEEILHTNTSKVYVFLGSGTTAAFLPGILNKGGGNSIVTFARLSVAFRMQMPVASEKIPLTTHCEESVALLSFFAEIQNCHCVVPDLKQKHKQVSGFQGSKPLCLSSTGDPCSALCSLLPSQRGGLPVVSGCPALHLGIKPDPSNTNHAPILVDEDWPPVGILRAASRWEKSPQYLSSKARHSL